MNTIIARTSDNKHLVIDKNLQVQTAFFIPVFSEDDDLNIGDNDPDLLGAIAAKVVGGKVKLFIYQGQMMAWTQTDIDYYPNNYVSFTTYANGKVVWQYDPGDEDKMIAYQSKSDGNTGHDPAADVSETYWKKIGYYKTAYDPDDTYDLNDLVIFDDGDGNFQGYISNKDDNNESLDAISVATWEPAGGSADKVKLNFTESDLVEEDYGGVWYLPVNLQGLDFLNAKIVADGVTEYKSIDALASHSDWDLPRLGGFSNNEAQTITITLI